MFASLFDQRSPTDQFVTPSSPISARIPQLSNIFSNSSWSQGILPSLVPFDSSSQSSRFDVSVTSKQDSLFNIHAFSRHGYLQNILTSLTHASNSYRTAIFILGSFFFIYLAYCYFIRDAEQYAKKVSGISGEESSYEFCETLAFLVELRSVVAFCSIACSHA